MHTHFVADMTMNNRFSSGLKCRINANFGRSCKPVFYRVYGRQRNGSIEFTVTFTRRHSSPRSCCRCIPLTLYSGSPSLSSFSLPLAQLMKRVDILAARLIAAQAPPDGATTTTEYTLNQSVGTARGAREDDDEAEAELISCFALK